MKEAKILKTFYAIAGANPIERATFKLQNPEPFGMLVEFVKLLAGIIAVSMPIAVLQIDNLPRLWIIGLVVISLAVLLFAYGIARSTQQALEGKIEQLDRLLRNEVLEHRQAQAELQQSQKLYRTLVSNFPNGGVFLFDTHLRFAIAGGRGLEAIGLSSEAVEGKLLHEVVSAQNYPLLDNHYRATLAGEARGFELEFGGCTYLIKTIPVKDECGTIFAGMAVAQEITERKQMEEALRTSDAEQKALFEAIADDIILVLDRWGRFLKIATTNTKYLYKPASELLNKTADEIFDAERAQYFISNIRRALDTQQTITLEYSLLIAECEVWFAAKISPLMADSVVCVIRDITEQKRAAQEIYTLNAELERRVLERTQALQVTNEELEAFCYSISHDLRSPLRRISGFSQAVLDDYGNLLEKTGKDYLQRLIAAVARMEQMIDALLNLSHLTLSQMECSSVSLSVIALNIAKELQHADPERLVTFKISSCPPAYGDPHLLRIVLNNLLGNAWKYTSKQSSAEIEFGIVTTTAIEKSPFLTFFVRDNGTGFNMNYASKLFSPFQRLHSDSDFAGTGIGLAIVQRIIRRHGGRVWAEATSDRGASFYFTLPAPMPELRQLR